MLRRDFLKGSISLPLLSPLALARSLDKPNLDSSEAWVRRARKSIPASKDAFFQTAGIGPSPKVVMKSVSEKLVFQNKGPVHPNISPSMSKIEPLLRKHLAKLFGAYEDEVALTHSTSEGINIASWAIDWKKGDEVMITNQEHPANTIPWYSLAKRFGIKIRRLNFNAGSNIVTEIKNKITNKTRMISIPHVSRNNGRALTVNEAQQISNLLKNNDVRFHLDGAQGPLCVPFNFHELGCDYYSTCGHKWILGPKGTGAFFCKREILDRTKLTWTGSHSHATMDQNGNYTLLPEARRFEFGTRALATFAGFDTALYWCEDLGMKRILNRIDELVLFAIEEWKQRGFKVSSPTKSFHRSGVFVINLPSKCDGWKVYDELRLNQRTFTSPVDAPNDLRIAIHFFNTRSEIKQTFDWLSSYCS